MQINAIRWKFIAIFRPLAGWRLPGYFVFDFVKLLKTVERHEVALASPSNTLRSFARVNGRRSSVVSAYTFVRERCTRSLSHYRPSNLFSCNDSGILNTILSGRCENRPSGWLASLTSSRRCALKEFLLQNAFSFVLQIRRAGKWILANRSAINVSTPAAEAF